MPLVWTEEYKTETACKGKLEEIILKKRAYQKSPTKIKFISQKR